MTPPSPPASVEVGRVAKPQGLRGEVVVDLASNRLERTTPGSIFLSRIGELRVASSRKLPGRSRGFSERWVLRFEGVDDRDQAERLRGLVLEAEPLEDPEALWVHDLVGSEVIDAGGSRLGRVVSVLANPASDLLELEGGGLVPLTFVTGVEPGEDANIVTVDIPEGLLE